MGWHCCHAAGRSLTDSPPLPVRIVTDIELVERASWACGIGKGFPSADHSERGIWFFGDGHGLRWNPLTDDGDALRLATTLGLSVEPYPYYTTPKHSVIVKQRRRGDQMRESNPTEVVEVYGDDAAAATRRAIVRAAAAVALAGVPAEWEYSYLVRA